MFRSVLDHPQGDIYFFFMSITKDKLFRFVVACLLYLLSFVLILRTLPSLVVVVRPVQYNNQAREGTQNQHKTQI
jgi:hypothetical protein